MPRRLQGWAALPQGESSAARSRETGGTIGCAVLELPGGVRIRFRDQPAAFVAACAVEAGLRSSSSLASQERSTASQASSAPTAASRRRLRRKKSLRRRQEAAAAAAAPASSAPQSSSVSSAPSKALSARTSIESVLRAFESRSERLKIKVCVGCQSRVVLVGLDMNYICTAGVTEMCSCHLLLKGSL